MATKTTTTCDICGQKIHSDGIKICIKIGYESDLLGRMFDICETCAITETLYRINEHIEDIKDREFNITK